MNRHEYDQEFDPLDRRQPPRRRTRPRRKRLDPLHGREMAMIGWRAHLGFTGDRDREWKRTIIRGAFLIGTPLLVLLLYFSFLAGAMLKPKAPATPKPKRASKIVWVKLSDAASAATPAPEQGDGKEPGVLTAK